MKVNRGALSVLLLIFFITSYNQLYALNLDGVYENAEASSIHNKIIVVKGKQFVEKSNYDTRNTSRYGWITRRLKNIIEVTYYKGYHQDWNIGTVNHYLYDFKAYYRVKITAKRDKAVGLEEVYYDESVDRYIVKGKAEEGTLMYSLDPNRERYHKFNRTEKEYKINNKGGYHCTCPRKRKGKYGNTTILSRSMLQDSVYSKKLVVPNYEDISDLYKLNAIEDWGKGTTFIALRSGNKIKIEVLYNDTCIADKKLRSKLKKAYNWKKKFDKQEGDIMYFDLETYDGKIHVHSPVYNKSDNSIIGFWK